MKNVKTKRARAIPDMHQPALGFEKLSGSPEINVIAKVQNIGFHEGNPDGLFIGDQRLEFYLKDNGFGYVVELVALLKAFDFSSFFKFYNSTGRHAIHPRIMLGLIVYGILNNDWSLRQLETLARINVGAWLVCGGLQPDHSTIGKFLVQHAELLTEEFFIAFTQMIVKRLKLKSHVAAGDGTVIEAASSRFRVLKAQAAQQVAKEAEEEASLDPENKEKRANAELAREAADKTKSRQEALKKAGKTTNNVCVTRSEPEAAVQPLKNKVTRPSYKPSILADENGLIVGQQVHPTNENVAIKPMLEQHEEIHGHLPETTLLDAGYHNIDVLKVFLERDLDVLCPSGAVDKTGEWEKESKNQIGKKSFKYDEEKDVYICPRGKELVSIGGGRTDANGRKFHEYRGKECENCPLRAKCTKSKRGRQVKRYEGEEVKEAMAEVMQNPRAQELYKQRKAMAERPFAELKERQGLKRFHRRGLQNVRLEFALHCIAFNIKKALQLGDELSFAFFALYWRQNGGSWKIHSLYFMNFPSSH